MILVNIFYGIIITALMIYVLQKMTSMTIVLKKKVIFIIAYSLIIVLCSYVNVVIRQVLISIIFVEVVHRYFGIDYYKAIISGILGIIFISIGDIISVFILHSVVGFSVSEVKNELILTISAYLIISLTVILIIYFYGKLNSVIGISEGLDIKKSIVSILYIISTMMLIGVISKIYEYIPNNVDKTYIFLFLILVIMFIVINFVVLYINKRYIIQKSEYEQLKIYTVIVEDLVSDIRKFRHDYVNIISSINGFVENEDISGLKGYFNDEVVRESRILYNNNNMLQLQNITNPAVKGLVSSKIVQAENLEINLNVEIVNEIKDIPVKTFDICRILGIIIDNSIEAAIQSEEKIMNIGMIDDEQDIVFLISNTYKNLPRISDMFKEGFSTKGENRGIGLNTVRNIVDNNYSNILLNTFNENGMLKQEINIKKKG